MIIALDYDDTFTKAPDFWYDFMAKCDVESHLVIGVTMRHESEAKEMNSDYLRMCEKVYYTDRKAKRDFMADLGIHVDIWIDDRPDFIIKDALPREIEA